MMSKIITSECAKKYVLLKKVQSTRWRIILSL